MKIFVRTFFATLVFAFLTAETHAQVSGLSSANPAEVRELRLFEYEFAVGMNFARTRGDTKAKMGGNFILEMRLNRPEPFDFGLQFKMGNFIHEERDLFRVNSKFIRPTLFFDYNRRFRNTTLFAGLGIGGSFVQNDVTIHVAPNVGLWGTDYVSSFAVTPRVGIVVAGFFRITAGYVFTERDYSCFELNAGFTFGGSYKTTPAERYNHRKTFF